MKKGYPVDLEKEMLARNVPFINGLLKKGRVAIAGLGGLGSNIAVMLARVGVGHLFLVDFDIVEPSNLNRQHYNLTHLGKLKTEALKSQIDIINPFVETKTLALKITEDNVCEVFKDYEIVCEAFDNPVNKAMLVNSLLFANKTKIVAASGMAGIDGANQIQTLQKFKNLYVCGDSVPALEGGIGLMSPRVMICAGHQASMVLKLLLGQDIN